MAGLLTGVDAGRAYDIIELVRSLEQQLDETQRDLRAVRLGRDKAIALLDAEAEAKENGMDEQVTAVTIPPRPKPTKDDLKKPIANELAEQIIDWLGDEAELHEFDDIAEQVVEALDTEYRWNGANLAAWFKSEGWTIDMELAEILDQAESVYRRLAETLVRSWVAANGIINRYGVGAAVTWQDYPAEITGLDINMAHYIVHVPEMGHVKDGTGVLGLIVPFEDLEAQT